MVDRLFVGKADKLDDIRSVDKRGVYRESVRDERVEEQFSDAPMAPGRLLVAITRTFFLCLSLSSWVRRALTTCGVVNAFSQGIR